MSETKSRSLLAAAAVLGLGSGLAIPQPTFDFGAAPKCALGNKGRSNNKPGARAKDRERTKSAHKSRMAQKRKK